jgi:hypothetical protein
MFGTSLGAAPSAWPPLPTSGFVSGRVASEDDLKRGNAVYFSLIDGKPSGKPAQMQVPQFAYLIEEDGNRRPVVVVQAEIVDGRTILGMRDVNGHEYVATEPEVELLGQTHP